MCKMSQVSKDPPLMSLILSEFFISPNWIFLPLVSPGYHPTASVLHQDRRLIPARLWILYSTRIQWIKAPSTNKNFIIFMRGSGGPFIWFSKKKVWSKTVKYMSSRMENTQNEKKTFFFEFFDFFEGVGFY